MDGRTHIRSASSGLGLQLFSSSAILPIPDAPVPRRGGGDHTERIPPCRPLYQFYLRARLNDSRKNSRTTIIKHVTEFFSPREKLNNYQN